MKETKEKNLDPDGYVYEELAECLLLQSKADAKTYFRKAFDILSKDEWLQANEPDRLARMEKLGRE